METKILLSKKFDKSEFLEDVGSDIRGDSYV